MDMSTTIPQFATLPREGRQILLEGPYVSLIVMHNGTYPQHVHQLSAAKGVVSADCYRQLLEQCERDRPVVIDFPARALCAASPSFAEYYGDDEDYREVVMEIDGVLPGFVMDVLDWFAKALNASKWVDFLDHEPSIDGADKFYYFYPYLAMRIMYMDTFADALQPFIEKLINQHELIDEAWTAEIFLSHLSTDDPLLQCMTERYAKLIVEGNMPLSSQECEAINKKFPHFGAMVADLLGNAVGGEMNDDPAINQLALQVSSVL